MVIPTLCKLYPTKSQIEILDHWMKISTDCYNTYVDRMVEKAEVEGKNYGAYRWKKILTQEKKPEWNEVNRSILNNDLFNIEIGIQTTLTLRRKASFFKSEKKRKRYESTKFPHKKDKLNWLIFDNGYKINGNYLEIKKTGRGLHGATICAIQFRGSRNIPNSIICPQIIITRKNSEWFLILYHKTEDNIYPVNQPNDIIGLDWGLNTCLVSNEGEKFDTPVFRSESENNKYNELQRKLTKQKKGSKRYDKTRLKMRKLKTREIRRKKDFYFKLALSFVTSYKIICIEDLDLDELRVKKKRHGKKMDRQAVSIFFYSLEWMAQKYGSTLVKVNPYLTSKTCNDCGYVKKDLTQKDREWTCPNCGCYHDRDHNAAINIRNLGLYTLRIRGSAREVKGRLPSIKDCFQATGIKREVIQTLERV